MDEIHKIYEKTGYFENYGISMLLAIIIIFITFAIVAYNSSQSVFKMMKTNWAANRCNPIYMPFAGIVMPIPGVSSLDNVSENFNYCIQSDLSAIFSVIMLPIEFGLYLTVECLDAAIYASALLTMMIKMFQDLLGSIFKGLFDKIINFITPVIVMCINAREIMAKMNGVLVTVLYSVMGVYNFTIAGTSLMLNLVLDVIVITIGVILALMVIAILLFAFFFTSPAGIIAAGVATGLLVFAGTLTILYVIMDAFTTEVFHIVNKQVPPLPSTSLKKKRR